MSIFYPKKDFEIGDVMDIGKKLRGLRKLYGLSGIELGKKADIGQSTISEIEAGKRSPTVETVEKICGALNVRIVDLFDEKLDEPELIELLNLAKKLTLRERRAIIELVKIILQKGQSQ